MRLPKISQLTRAQKQVYLYATTDRHVLVQGPPGTGKTLIACLRAQELGKKKTPFVLGMFSRVLVRYSSNVADGGTMPAETVLSWFRNWWNRSGLPPHPQCSKLYVEVPYEEKDEARAAGARWFKNEWRPWATRTGVWMVDPEIYFAHTERFAKWRVWHSPPAAEGKGEGVDWQAVSQHLLEFEETIPLEVLEIGTFLLDEGQDFPPSFYKALRQISALGQSHGVLHPLRCFILADENQQLTEENSTLDDIVQALKVADDDRYTLLDNFRNTREIAELARHFFADVGVLPKVPERSGACPTFAELADQSDIVQRVKIWMNNNPGKEVGVLTFSESARSSLFDRLSASLQRVKGRTIRVQTYSWKTKHENKVDDLVFDAPDVVTVLNMQSCKGLEFDAVFVADLHEARIGLFGPDRFRMQMFVAVSRGRQWVSLLDSGMERGTGGYVSFLPEPEFLEREAPAGLAPKPRGAAVARSDAGREAVSTPKSITPIKVRDSEWESVILGLAKSGKVTVDDRRLRGGALWVQGGAELRSIVEPLGFQFSNDRGAWWRK